MRAKKDISKLIHVVDGFFSRLSSRLHEKVGIVGLLFVVFQTIIMCQQTEIMNRQTELTEKQTIIAEVQTVLSQAPVVSIEVENGGKGADGNFRIRIVNSGVTDLAAVRLYRDAFVALKEPSGQLTLTRFGNFFVTPDYLVSELAKGSSQTIVLTLSDVYEQMRRFYLSERKGARMMVVRLSTRYVRKLDGKEFDSARVFILAAGEFLLSPDFRNLESAESGISFEEVKSTLLAGRD